MGARSQTRTYYSSGVPGKCHFLGRAEAVVAFFLRAPADLESVGRGGSTTITFVAKQLNHGLSLPTKRSGIVYCDLLAERKAERDFGCKSNTSGGIIY